MGRGGRWARGEKRAGCSETTGTLHLTHLAISSYLVWEVLEKSVVGRRRPGSTTVTTGIRLRTITCQPKPSKTYSFRRSNKLACCAAQSCNGSYGYEHNLHASRSLPHAFASPVYEICCPFSGPKLIRTVNDKVSSEISVSCLEAWPEPAMQRSRTVMQPCPVNLKHHQRAIYRCSIRLVEMHDSVQL